METFEDLYEWLHNFLREKQLDGIHVTGCTFAEAYTRTFLSDGVADLADAQSSDVWPDLPTSIALLRQIQVEHLYEPAQLSRARPEWLFMIVSCADFMVESSRSATLLTFALSPNQLALAMR